MVIALAVAILLLPADPQKPAPPAKRPVAAPGPYTATLSLAEMANKQAVVNTSAGSFVIDLKPELAPNHVGYFMKLAGEGAYNGTVFHRIIRHGIVQGGDPLSKDPAKASLYGTGGLGVLKAEIFDRDGDTWGGGCSDSAGQTGQCRRAILRLRQRPAGARRQVHDLRAGIGGSRRRDEDLRGGRHRWQAAVARRDHVGHDSRYAAAGGRSRSRPSRVAQLAAYRAVLETSAGPITIEFLPDKAPGHVRNFLRLAQAGVYDGMSFHRVVKGFAVQTGSITSRGPLTEKQQKLVRQLAPEFNDTRHVKGIVSMARGDDPGSATTSFFIVTAAAPSLDDKYTAFGRVVEGLAVLDAIEQAPVNGEEPVARIDLKSVRIVPPSK